MPTEVAMKCTFRHFSHMMPMWIGMAGDYGMFCLAAGYEQRKPDGSCLSISLSQLSLLQQG
jgi:hypothetical protein